MFAEPVDFDRRLLLQLLTDDWGLSVSTLSYEPVGFGTHHYVVREEDGLPWWVNVDDLAAKTWLGDDAREALDKALKTAVALRRAQLEFVHAPIETSEGNVLASVDARYAVSVYSYVEGRSNAFGAFASDDERRLVLKALGRMHNVSDVIPSGLPRRDTLEVPSRERFFEALDDLGSAWQAGPFSEPTRELLKENAGAIRAEFERYDDLAVGVRANSDEWVVAHGEPHGGNIIRTKDDALLLVDWDTVAMGPRERDLWMVEPSSDEDWEAYVSGGGTSVIDPRAIELYNLWWTLAEIAGCTDTLRSSHGDDPNSQHTWIGFQKYVATASGKRL